MANTKITDLGALLGSSAASTDVAVVVDVSDTTMAASGTDKKITLAELGTALGAVGGLATTSAVAAGYQPLDSDLTAIAALTTTSYGRALLALADAAALRTAAGLGTAATVDTGTGSSNVPTKSQADTLYQPLDSDLTAIAALTTTSYGRALLELANLAALQALLGTGTPSSSTYLRGDGSWATPAGGSSYEWSTVYAGVSGRYYVPATAVSGRSTQAQGSGDTRFAPFAIDTSVTFDRIGCETTTSPGSGNVRLAIFNDSNGRPGTLVLDAGQVDSSTAAVKEITISQALTAGRYWLGIASQGATVTIRTYGATPEPQSGYTATSQITGTGSTTGRGLLATGITGAFSSSPTTSPGDSCPVIFLRAA